MLSCTAYVSNPNKNIYRQIGDKIIVDSKLEEFTDLLTYYFPSDGVKFIGFDDLIGWYKYKIRLSNKLVIYIFVEISEHITPDNFINVIKENIDELSE